MLLFLRTKDDANQFKNCRFSSSTSNIIKGVMFNADNAAFYWVKQACEMIGSMSLMYKSISLGESRFLWQWPSPCGCWELQSFSVCLGMMDDTCTHWAITPWCSIVCLSHFCVGENCLHSRAKTNPDNHLICMMYDLLSLDDKLSDDLECLANTAAAITSASTQATCWSQWPVHRCAT